mmetsp:Transcript_9099/g.32738  ORF Transcript_9099/g.32738 Transcript_9099/m.32738 type:complete len:438 (-) Transcript_9099:192-1505(-)
MDSICREYKSAVKALTKEYSASLRVSAIAYTLVKVASVSPPRAFTPSTLAITRLPWGTLPDCLPEAWASWASREAKSMCRETMVTRMSRREGFLECLWLTPRGSSFPQALASAVTALVPHVKVAWLSLTLAAMDRMFLEVKKALCCCVFSLARAALVTGLPVFGSAAAPLEDASTRAPRSSSSSTCTALVSAYQCSPLAEVNRARRQFEDFSARRHASRKASSLSIDLPPRFGSRDPMLLRRESMPMTATSAPSPALQNRNLSVATTSVACSAQWMSQQVCRVAGRTSGLRSKRLANPEARTPVPDPNRAEEAQSATRRTVTAAAERAAVRRVSTSATESLALTLKNRVRPSIAGKGGGDLPNWFRTATHSTKKATAMAPTTSSLSLIASRSASVAHARNAAASAPAACLGPSRPLAPRQAQYTRTRACSPGSSLKT